MSLSSYFFIFVLTRFHFKIPFYGLKSSRQKSNHQIFHHSSHFKSYPMYSDKTLSKKTNGFFNLSNCIFFSTTLRIVPQNLDLSALRTQLRNLFILHLAQRRDHGSGGGPTW
jgi:hypothetical protein